MFSFIKLVNFFSVLHRLITHRLIPALFCFLLCISNTQAQTQPTGYGGISDFVKHDRSTIPSLTFSAEFGSAIVDIGDIDGDDVDDLVVGGHLRNVGGAGTVGSIYILRMNADNTVKGISEITHGIGDDDIKLTTNDRFGSSVANIGDFDGDGINELAVGIGGGPRGVIYILHLTENRVTEDVELKSFSTIDFNDINDILGNDDLDDDDRFGASIANMGDIDGDGIIDLAVGAFLDDERFGSVHILFMNNTGNSPTLKAAAKIDTSGLTAFNDFFGISVANIGDLNGDRINDLAVGAFLNDEPSRTDQGAVHVFLLNRDGSRKADNFEIFDTNGNIFSLSGGDNAGRSIANLGDLNGDGINDIAVGAIGVDPGTTGAVFTIFMNRMKDQITAADIPRITHNSLPDLNLATDDRFGLSVANIGDRNRDGINDIAVGAASENGTGSFYILHMDAETVITDVTAAAVADGNYPNSGNNAIDIQVRFSEPVEVTGVPLLRLENGLSAGVEATYFTGSGSDTLTFDYVIGFNDRATDLDYEGTDSLSLNGGMITAATTPKHMVLLTLPEPGSRGSLSSNKNIAINVSDSPALRNDPPMGPTPLLQNQVLTVGAPFEYTIAGSFSDPENDALTYTATLPAGLSLDSITGIISGAPTTMQNATDHTITISDGTASPITADISITVNPAPTLPTIEEKNYSLGETITSITLPTATGGTAPFIYTLSPALPGGLTFSSPTQTIEGTAPATDHTGQYTYTAEDENGALAAQTFTITVKAPPTLNSISDKIYLIGNPINEQLPAATEGTGPFTYELSPSSLPDGLMFDTGTRIISGIPTKAGQHIEYTYTATDSSLPVANEVSTNFSITIAAGAINSLPAKWNGHIFNIVKHGQSPPDIPIPDDTKFGDSIVNIGDINGDNIDDLVVGGSERGASGIGNGLGGIYILMMNADARVTTFTQIVHGTGGIQLNTNSFFGISMANIGDFDGDGINELAVGTLNRRIYILHLTNTGALERFSTLDFNRVNTILGNDGLDDNDGFGVSIANLGDIDGDGIIDLAVGAHRDDGIGSVHILFMERIGNDLAIKAAAKIDPSGFITNDGAFGISVANIGDLNQDRINDLAVGAFNNNGNHGTNQGAVHVLLLNRDGSIKPGGFEILDTNGNIFGLSSEDQAGRAIANLGDLNGDGINDIAIGGIGINGVGLNDTGAVLTVFMKRMKDQITADDISIITHNSPSDLTLAQDDSFGQSIANIGDRNGDGINDIAVGAIGTNPAETGAFYILHMDAETVITAVTAATANGRHDTNALINIQVIFSEAVNVTGTPSLSLGTGNNAEATYTGGSGTNTLIFAYTVAASDSATDLDYEGTDSLIGTITAAATPKQTAILTLPAPGSRGSLSSNKNIAINSPALRNDPPMGPTPLLQNQVLTVGAPFEYTIAGSFSDPENDALTYTPLTTPPLPSGLSLDSITGIISGTPTTEQSQTGHTITISDGRLSTMADINITVNPAPTLPTISDKIYLPEQPVNVTLPDASGGRGPFTYTLSPVLPDGLTFTGQTIEGTAPATESIQTQKYTYTAEDENGALTAQTFTITTEALQALGISNKVYLIGRSVNEQLPATTGGPGDITYALSPPLSNGLEFDAGTRTISGTPEIVGTTEYTYTATPSLFPAADVSTTFLITIVAEAISSRLAKGTGHISNGDQVSFSGIPAESRFGSAVINIGDIDNNGTDDFAVGASENNQKAGAVYILLMDDDTTGSHTVESHTVIGNRAPATGCAAGNITLGNNSFFGVSLANIGDFDNDGINELAVGATAGRIYILHLTYSDSSNSVELACFSTITFNDINHTLNEISLVGGDRFGVSIANLGDIDGDGIIDLAVGAHLDDGQGAVYILFMDNMGNSPVLKAAIKIDTSDLGLSLSSGDQFGISVAGIGDLNEDGINDLAVGAIRNNGDRGAVHILLLNRDGSRQGGFEIFDTESRNIFGLNSGDQAGRSIANLGDLNGDGINDIAVGAPGVDPGTTGAVFTVLMKRAKEQITTNDFVRITNIPHSDLDLSDNDRFGTSIANIGDRNRDGINDIAVGAVDTNPDPGTLYILYMDAETVITAVTAVAADGAYNTNKMIDIQIIFSEAVEVVGSPRLALKTNGLEEPSSATYTTGTGTDTLIFEYTVAGDDEAQDLDYVSTMSLTLNGGTISAAATPNHPALLTLPAPGSRGSLSSNKNLAINIPVTPNTAPMASATIQIEDLELTADTSFTYTIPAGTFTDAENDPLTYTSSALPAWLSLNPTGTFSGTPETIHIQLATAYSFTVSDGTTLPIEANINITVNPAPTLPTISNKNYVPDQSISITLPAATGGTTPITYTLSPVLPDELTFDDMARTITGTAPAIEQIKKYTYTAADRNGALATQPFNINILETQHGGISNIVKHDISSLNTNARFGRSITNMGDIDKNGTDDLAVGASGLSIGGLANTGGVYILLMNDDNTVLASRQISHGSAGGTFQLLATSFFGVSAANIGDFDGDGINELAVGAAGVQGAIYILHLTDTGELGHFSRIGFEDINMILDNDDLVLTERFGFSIANLGDIDGDGIIDLAVGAHQDDGQGSVHILFMNKTETGPTLKAVSKINTAALGLNSGDQFGSSVANIGDLNQDGINDLAVGAIRNDQEAVVGNDQGAVHILLLNRDGSIKPDGFEILDTGANNIFDLEADDRAGRGIANLGDLNGDGINDIVVGATRAGVPLFDNTGEALTIFMRKVNNQITASNFLRINSNSHFGLNLLPDDQFGESIANIGDRNGDGINDIAIGAPGTGTIRGNAGAFYMLYMSPIITVNNVTAAEPNGAYDTGEMIDIQVIFSEAVNVDTSAGTPTLTLETGPTGPSPATYTTGSGSDTLTFEYTVANDDSATDLDYVSTMSLTLNGGIINSTATSGQRALLTLPVPGSRGSLSSNKNLAINPSPGTVFTNTPPTADPDMPIPDQTLTVGTSFTYTIPAGTFNDIDNDPLTYTPSSPPPFPAWLNLDSTGIFSGTPLTAQDSVQYAFTVSDGTSDILANIRIKINPMLTLPTINDINYSPDDQIDIVLPQATGGTTPTYTLSPVLPDGLTFDDTERMITGTRTEEHTAQYTYTAADKNGALAAQTFTLTIRPLQALNSISNKIYPIGIEVIEQLPATTGGTGELTYTLLPTLLAGLMFDAGTRTILGMPSKTGQSDEYTYTATDSSAPMPNVVSTEFSITIAAETTSSRLARGTGHISGIINLGISANSAFGGAVINIGNIDGKGGDDLAVGAPGDASNRGAVYILLMNADDTIASHTVIGNGTDSGCAAGNIALNTGNQFGVSLANIGDFELAVGATAGRIYILHLTASGGLDCFSRIAFSDINNILGNNELDGGDRFGVSIANMGDIDGDGIIDLAVGAHRDDNNKGSVHILFMDKIGNSSTLKAVAKIDTNGLGIANNNNDQFGISVANIGDLDQDRINDLAVGEIGNDGDHGNDQGAVHVFLLNRDGSIKPGNFEIFNTNGNIFSLSDGDQAGRAIANLGDLNGDGINDIAVGAPGVNLDTGTVFTIFMERAQNQITADALSIITHTNPSTLTLSAGDLFGTSIANIGDRNGDGISDIAVGAPGNAGALYILYMDAETVITAVTSTAENRNYTTGTIDIQVIFSEIVTVDTAGGTPTLTMQIGSPAIYTGGTGSNILTFDYTVGSDLTRDLDYASTDSLTLNGGAIVAAEAPNSSAVLTLPKPNSRGSLSSNKNLYINTAVITNRHPTGGPIPEQILTAGTSFTYTIPAGTFSDADYDPLIYTPESGFPDWLSLDSITGTFSGAPPATAQPTINDIYNYIINISDGTASITPSPSIRITVNPAPTLPTIRDESHTPETQISINLPAVATGTGTAPIKYTLLPAVLPGDLTFDDMARTIAGMTPALPGEVTEQTRRYTYTAEDANGALVAQTFNLSVALVLDLNLRIKVFLEGAQ